MRNINKEEIMFFNYNRIELIDLYNHLLKSNYDDVWYNEKKYNKQYVLKTIKGRLK